jgi:uncharacterized protein
VSEVGSETTIGEQKDPNLLFVEENTSYRLSLYLENEQMECAVRLKVLPSLESNDSPALLTPPELIWFLTQNNIIESIDYPALYEFCALVEFRNIPESYIVAKGRSPEKGVDGWFELTVKTGDDGQEFIEDGSGHVDFRTLNAYSEIEAGHKLGIVHPPQEGLSGVTVTGTPIAADVGDPFELVAGEGVELKFGGRVAFSTKSGRALFEKNKVLVVDQLVISGDLDLSVGNIDFNGFVEIKGDVPDDYQVKSTKGIKVGGLVGACRLESGGSIELTSMAGKEVGEIICHGALHSSFLNQVSVTSYADVYVLNEVRNSLVKSTGKIVVEKGSIIGGMCTAMEGIETKIAGTSSGQKTQLIAGVYFPDNDRFEYLRQELISLNRQIASLNDGLTPLVKYVKRHPTAGETTHKRLQILQEKMTQLVAEKERLSAEVIASAPQQFKSQNPKINIHKSLMEGVSITLGGSSEEIRQPRTGPLSIIENSEDGGMRYLSLTPLQVHASVVEEELLII